LEETRLIYSKNCNSELEEINHKTKKLFRSHNYTQWRERERVRKKPEKGVVVVVDGTGCEWRWWWMVEELRVCVHASICEHECKRLEEGEVAGYFYFNVLTIIPLTKILLCFIWMEGRKIRGRKMRERKNVFHKKNEGNFILIFFFTKVNFSFILFLFFV